MVVRNRVTLLNDIFLEGLISSWNLFFLFLNVLSAVRKILRRILKQLSHRRLSLVYSTFWYCHLSTKTETNRHLNMLPMVCRSDELLTTSCHLLLFFFLYVEWEDVWQTCKIKQIKVMCLNRDIHTSRWSIYKRQQVKSSEKLHQLLCLRIWSSIYAICPMDLSF